MIPYFSIISLFVNCPLFFSFTTAHLISLEYIFFPTQKHLRFKYFFEVYPYRRCFILSHLFKSVPVEEALIQKGNPVTITVTTEDNQMTVNVGETLLDMKKSHKLTKQSHSVIS